MSGTARYRERYTDVYTQLLYKGKPYYSATTHIDVEQCTDVIGDFGNDHTFYHRKRDTVSALKNGTIGNDTIINHPCTAIAHTPSLPAWDATSYATTAMARTNPSRPHVQLPVFIFELRDIPKMLKQAGRLYHDAADAVKKAAGSKRAQAKGAGKYLGGHYLSYQFGWKPFLSDLRKIVAFQSTVERRLQEINRLTSKNGLKRRVQLNQEYASESYPNETISSVAGRVRGTPFSEISRKTWATLRWVPNDNSIPESQIARANLLKLYVFGLHWSQMSLNLWEALPWSWLADWCANVGEYLQARNNTLAMLSGNVNVMRETKQHTQWAVTEKPSGITLTPIVPTVNSLTKERFLSTGGLTASLPILTGRQMAILGSLAILRS